MEQTATIKKTEAKTIDINGKEWFDKVNGNSYFSAEATVNFGMEDERTFKVPFQYGYGDSYIHEAGYLLCECGELALSLNEQLYVYCDKNDIILRTHKETGCKKRDCK